MEITKIDFMTFILFRKLNCLDFKTPIDKLQKNVIQ